MEHIGSILRNRKVWERGEADKELEREEAKGKASRDFDVGIGPGLVEYIRDIRRRQESEDSEYNISSMLWQLSGISPDSHQVFANFKLKRQYPTLKQALEASKSWVRFSAKPFLTLAGTPGVGKTFLAKASTQEIIKAGGLVIYRRVKDLLEELRRDTFEKRSSDLITDLRQVTFLIIDDLGVQKSSEWSLEALDDIVDYRYSMKRPLMVCTNAKSEDLPPRIADRLADRFIGEVVQIAAPSYRRGS